MEAAPSSEIYIMKFTALFLLVRGFGGETHNVLAFKFDCDLNRAAANFAILDKLLLAAACPVEPHAQLLAAVRAREKIILFDRHEICLWFSGEKKKKPAGKEGKAA